MGERILFGGLLIGWFVLAMITVGALFFVVAPYGRHVRKGWGPTVENRLGWVIMEAPSVLVFGVCFAVGQYRDNRICAFPTRELLVIIGLNGVGALPEIKGSLGGYKPETWRREWDSNPRRREPHRFSRPAPSTTRPSLRDPQLYSLQPATYNTPPVRRGAGVADQDCLLSSCLG